nr:protein O-glucosyltransferase 1-like [Coffea arabica]
MREPGLGKNNMGRSSVAILFLVLLCIGAFLTTHLLDSSSNLIPGSSRQGSTFSAKTSKTPEEPLNRSNKLEFQLNCSLGDETRICLGSYYPSKFMLQNPDPSSSTPQSMCPDYFRWIHEDLSPWRETGVTEEMVRMAGRTANFRVVVVNGTAYLETFDRSFQTRDVFSQWGILQLLRRYPGKIPDLDLMFDCDDSPVVRKEFHRGPDAPPPPPVFRYCKDDATLDIVFPDWSFWGWAEIDTRPWAPLLKEMKDGNERSKWKDRKPYAYWKGNPHVAEGRVDLLKCNVSDKEDWNARLYVQDWNKEQEQGYKESVLADQCVHRYKIYIEGSAWSVSQKNILACDSVTLLVKPQYHEFFSRGLMPLQHYWPIRADDKCRSIKYAVEWGNNNEKQAEEIGKAGSSFVQEELKMDYVYDYMFHLLSQYAKLLKYKPSIPPKAIELCSESMACPAQALEKKFMMESMVGGPSSEAPCIMPPPYDPAALHSILEEKQNSIQLVEEWEKQHGDGERKHP